MSELTLHLAESSDLFTLNVAWVDKNNIQHETRLTIKVIDLQTRSDLRFGVNGHQALDVRGDKV